MGIENSKYIIAVDLDDTLLNSKGEVSKNTLDVLKKYKNNGCVIVISSARGYSSCENIAKLISADYVCCQAGNMIVDKNKKIIYKNPFKQNEIACFLDYFLQYTKAIIIDSDFNLYGCLQDDFSKKWGVVNCSVDELKNINSYKICITYKNLEFKQKIVNFCAKQNYVCREMRGANNMLITPQNSDKYYALEKLVELLHTDISKLIVFGDDHSDLLSIQKAGYGVAMQNSKQEVLDNAKYITTSNDKDGVIKFLEQNFKL